MIDCLINAFLLYLFIFLFLIYFIIICILIFEEPNKENQDSYSIIPNFEKIKDGAYFAVYDGHGVRGNYCSRFVRDKVSSIRFF